MSGLTPIPTTRVSDLLARTRLTRQLQQDQLDLFRIQDQLSTGRRISLPSDDAPAALRAITLQRLLERKEQVQTNLATNQSFLAASDSALATVSGLLADIRGAALGVAGTTNTNEQRQAVAEQVGRALEQLVDVGNQQFRGRYLFAGSRTGDRPYEFVGDYVQYNGNERNLRSYSDLDVLFETNITGGQVFGAISEPVQGTIDLNPHVAADTLLSSLRGGQGISPNGAITISDGSRTSTVDLSNASTVGDVAALIEANPPAGRTVTVELTSTSLSISLDLAGGGNLSISEVAGGNTAHELGIFEENGVVVPLPLVGDDLNPIIEKTTPIGNLLGSKSNGTFIIPGANNDLLIESTANGSEFDVDVSFVAGGTAGSEIVTYTPGAPGTLAIQIESGKSTAAQVAAAITAEGTFSARIDNRDAPSLPQSGNGSIWVDPTVSLSLSGGSGIVFDGTGLQIANRGQSFTVDLSAAVTVEDALNEINGAGAGVLAQINASGDGINIRSRISGSDFSIGENGGTTAAELGLRTFTEATRLDELNFGVGVPVRPGQATGTFTFDSETLDIAVVAGGAAEGAEGGEIATIDVSYGNVVESATYDPGTNTLTVALTQASGVATHNDLIAAIDNGGDFDADIGGATSGPMTALTATAVSLTGGAYAFNTVDFIITANDGTELSIDVSHAETVEDVIALINDHPLNTLPTNVRAQLSQYGNGIELIDQSGGPGTLQIRKPNLSQAANYLGLIPEGATDATATAGPPDVLTGRDVNPLKNDSVFDTLVRLKNALEVGDIELMEDAISGIGTDITRVNFGRSEMGARQQSLEILQTRLEDEQVELKSALSLEIDADLTETISKLTARQISLQATLQTSANLLQLSILDFI